MAGGGNVLPPAPPGPNPVPVDWTTVTAPNAGDMNAQIRDMQNWALQAPAATLSMNSGVAIPNSAWTQVDWSTIEDDTTGGAMPDLNFNRLVATRTGIYRVHAEIQFNYSNGAEPGWSTIAIGRGDPANGANFLLRESLHTAAGNVQFNITGLIKISEGDAAYVMAYQDSGLSQVPNYSDMSGRPFFSMDWICDA